MNLLPGTTGITYLFVVMNSWNQASFNWRVYSRTLLYVFQTGCSCYILITAVICVWTVQSLILDFVFFMLLLAHISVLVSLGNPAQTSAKWSDIFVSHQTRSEDH